MAQKEDSKRQTNFCVGQWIVDPANNLLCSDEAQVNLEPKVMDVLVYLADHQGQVISREELEQAVWAGRIVSYDALTNSVVKLRKAMGHNKQQPIIKTVPKRGYSLVAAVSEAPAVNSDIEPASISPPTLSHEAATVSSPSPARGNGSAERRQVTVLACELININELDHAFDPEDVHEHIENLQRVCSEVVQRYGGHIAQYTNGEMEIYFGYPEAHEGDAERALRTGLDLIDAVRGLGEKNVPLSHYLSVRMGIHTGLVVVGELSSHDLHDRMSVVGNTPSLAASLKSLAPLGSIVASDSTQKLLENLFQFERLSFDDAQTKHFAAIYQVRAMHHTPSRSQSKVSNISTPLVGRDGEVSLILQRWQQSKSGESQVIMLCADAGIGKSRLLVGLQEQLKDEQLHRFNYYCSAYHRNSSLYPVIAQLQRILDIRFDDQQNQSLDKIESFLRDANLSVTEYAPVLASLLSLPSERYPLTDLNPQSLKKRTFTCFVELFKNLSSEHPLLIILEDAHWADPTSREWFELLINELRTHAVCFLTSYRPEYDPPWSAYMQSTLLRLNRLSKQATLELIENVSGKNHLPSELLDVIVNRTDGVPLYVEELTKSVLSSASAIDNKQQSGIVANLQNIHIPESLQDSLMSRLDKLKTSKPVAQLAATIGRSFGRELLLAIADIDEPQLDLALEELVAEELLYKYGIAPDYRYEFKHALVQDAAYQSLLKRTRQQYHQRIATVLEKQFAQISSNHPEVLAHHYSEAWQIEKAIAYWLKAGQRAIDRCANIEAIADLTKGLKLIQQLDSQVERNELELRYLLVLGPALLSTKGLGSSEAENAYLRARELCQQSSANEELFTVTWGLWLLCQKRGRLNEAKQFAEELLHLATILNNSEFDLQAHHAAWTTNFRLSEFPTSRIHISEGIKLYDVDRHSRHALRFGGHDPGVCGYYHAAINSWLMGFPESGQRYAQQAVALANKINHPFSQALARAFAGFVAQCCNDASAVRSHAQSIFSLCNEKGIAPELHAQAQVLLAWVESLSATCDYTQLIKTMESAIMAHRDTGVRSHEPYLYSVLADVCYRAGDAAKGLKTVNAALRSIEQTKESTFQAEILRLKGEFLLLDSNENRDQAIDCLEKATALAKQQQSHSLQLRSLISLLRNLQSKESIKLAANSLTQLLDWFSEGEQSLEQIQARQLLKSLH